MSNAIKKTAGSQHIFHNHSSRLGSSKDYRSDMLSNKVLLPTLAMTSFGLADFTFGAIQGLQVDGGGTNPALTQITGTWILGDEDYSQADFCNAGIGLVTDGDSVWESFYELINPDEPPNFCDKTIPGLDPNLRISNAAAVGGGDCGAALATGELSDLGIQLGAVVNIVTSPYAAVGKCYYDTNCKLCVNAGSQVAKGLFTCLGGSFGAVYGTGLEGVNTDQPTNDCGET